jgi:cyclase
MQMMEISPCVTAVIRPTEGANASLIHTDEGVVVVDTTSCAADMKVLLDAAEVSPVDVCLVINTHKHSDHTWGNQLFGCPILAHRLCREAMEAHLDNEWRLASIRASIVERGRSDPQWAAEMQEKIDGLQITLPTQTFDLHQDLVIGGVQIEVIHLGGHTPGSSVVWLPEAKVLFSGDLLFVERYPFIGDADIPDLIAALKRLRAFEAQSIVPGHGPLCGDAEIVSMLDYLGETWSRTVDHLAQGHTADEAASDPAYPRYAEGAAERYHETSIRVMYSQLAHGEACTLTS